MKVAKLTGFGLCVKTELLRRGMSQSELESIVSKETGLFVDSGYMYKILALPTSAWFFLFVTVRSMLCCIDN